MIQSVRMIATNAELRQQRVTVPHRCPGCASRDACRSAEARALFVLYRTRVKAEHNHPCVALPRGTFPCLASLYGSWSEWRRLAPVPRVL